MFQTIAIVILLGIIVYLIFDKKGIKADDVKLFFKNMGEKIKEKFPIFIKKGKRPLIAAIIISLLLLFLFKTLPFITNGYSYTKTIREAEKYADREQKRIENEEKNEHFSNKIVTSKVLAESPKGEQNEYSSNKVVTSKDVAEPAKRVYKMSDIGKIILDDGKIVSANEYDADNSNAVAVIWNIAKDGSYALGLGIHTGVCEWASKDCYGYAGRFEALEDLKDGSKALEIVKRVDPDGSKNLEKNYPALFFAESYGRRFNVGKFTDGWYIPTISETGYLLNWVWDDLKYSTEIDNTLAVIYGMDNFYLPRFWVSTSYRTRNSYYDYDTDNPDYVCPDIPPNEWISINKITVWGESGGFSYNNNDKFKVFVMRKFD
ncbi:MAG: hypothetical protein J5798_03200 [Spirochaetaceae bacterium]|nr:hypothetical protein [Spirochaetaceae bacterium]MBR4824645.1 hypothetical protein [Spirochaetaceae bacterium]